MSTETIAAIAAEDAADVVAAPVAQPGEAVPPAEVARIDLAAEIGGIVTMLVKVMAPAFPSLQAIYTEEVTAAAAGAVAAVCQKHNWLSDGIGGRYGEELAAVIIVGPLAIQTAAAVKADIAARQKTPMTPAGGVADLPAPPEQVGSIPATPTAPGMLQRG